jgi:hypothetical protein
MLDAECLGAAVTLDSVEDSLGGAGLARPKRVPSLGSLLEIPVAEELLAGCASPAGSRRQASPTA